VKNITLHQSNKTEILLDCLIEILKTPLSNPLAPETIVVQSKGMERWISLKLAEHMGCCANVRFPFPNAIVQSLFDYLMPELNVASDIEKIRAFDMDVMTWKLMRIIPSLLDQAPFLPLSNYLSKDAIIDLKKIQLCERIADTFEQYIIYRPDFIDAWERGQDDHWQAVLWRLLSRNVSDYHHSQLGKMALKRLFDKSYKPTYSFAERIFVFGISTLPVFHIQLLLALSQLCPIHIFVLNPSQEYWGEVKSKKEISKIRMKENAEESDLYLEEGHPILASMGKMGRDFLNLLYGYMDDHRIQLNFNDRFESVTAHNLLTHIQSQLFELDSPMHSPIQVDNNDRSIEIHSCHSPMREVEILHDQLRHMLENDPRLKPRDILVMTPDIETYAPLIQAVFENPNVKNAIPYAISDRNLRNESQIIDTFFLILDMVGSRLEATVMLAILECPAVARKFNINRDDMTLIIHWLEQTRLRWGQSGKHRTRFGMAAYSENTWQNSLDRLLLGYAMSGAHEAPFCDILPYDEIEGQDASIIGHLAQWTSIIFKYVNMLDTSRNLLDWIKVLNKLIDDCFQPHEDEDIQVVAIRKALHRLEKIAIYLNNDSNYPETSSIHFSAIKWYLNHFLEKPGSYLGFLSGHVTCCAMLPMRAIPFKVICMIGLNDADYPRIDRSLNFNFIAQKPRLGDRSLRNDDRYIFLEAILSARKCLYMSYIGQSITDNSSRPASVLITELLDYIDDHFQFLSGKARQFLITWHRLQAFHPAYYIKASRLFSYSKDNYIAAQTMISNSKDNHVSFISRPVTDEVEKNVHISELLNFYKNPISYFFNHRLGIFLYDRIQTFDRREPFEIGSLDAYLLKVDLLDKMLANNNPYDLLPQIRARCVLPLGQIGRLDYYEIIERLDFMVDGIRPLIKNSKPDLSVDLTIDKFRLFGNIKNLFEQGLVLYRPATSKAEDFINCWLNHLILNYLENDNQISFIVASDGIYQLSPVKNSKAILNELLLLYQKGLFMPIHFFPKTSYAFVDAIYCGKSETEALIDAQNKWLPNNHIPTYSDSENLYHIRYFQTSDPFTHSFREVAKTVFVPIIKHMKKIK
jgi:exodeoxyribonuclease V gamma subunit